jgi:hypothetical protein
MSSETSMDAFPDRIAGSGTPRPSKSRRQEFRITFPDVSAAARSRLASGLRDTLAHVKSISNPSVLRERPDTQDSGTILSVVLAAPAVVMAVNALAAWLDREHASVTIERPDGTVVLKDMKSGDVPNAIEALKNLLE